MKETHPFDALIELPMCWHYRERRNTQADYWLVSRWEILTLKRIIKNQNKL